MSAAARGLTLRPITGPDEMPLFNRLPYTLNHELADDLAEGRRRPEWMWLALDGDRPLARVAWWGRPDEAAPRLLDILDLDDDVPGPAAREAAAALFAAASAAVLPAGAAQPEYLRFVPADWRENAASTTAVEARTAVVEAAGARLTVERLRLEWRPGTPVPAPDPRLAFREPASTDELLDLMTRTLDGTLDAHSRAALADMTPREAALDHYEGELARYTSPHAWWRVATSADAGGAPVGFVIPARNSYNPVMAYLGVLPDYRGRGYIDGILAEGTRVLAGQDDVPRIRASTDLTNVPMARAFERAGYVAFERVLDYGWDAASD